MSIGNLLESLSQGILVGIIVVGRLGVGGARILSGAGRARLSYVTSSSLSIHS